LAEVLTKSDNGEDSPENIVESEQYSCLMNTELKKVLDTLDPRRKSIVLKRVLIDDEKKVSLQEMGKEFGVSLERIRQLEVDVIRKIKESIVKSGLMDLAT
jgi:RNA polymerase nonessential primary-like sigma factor